MLKRRDPIPSGPPIRSRPQDAPGPLWRRRRTHWLRRCVGGLLQLLRGRTGGLLRFFHRVLSRVLRFFAKLLELRLRFLNLFVGSFLCLFGFASLQFCFVSSAFCLRSSDVFLSQPDTANPSRAVSAMVTEVIRFMVIIARMITDWRMPTRDPSNTSLWFPRR